MRALAQQPVRYAPVLQGVGHHMGHAALGGLLQGHVPQPLAEEGVRVAQEGGRPAEDLRVARPAHALVPLGAVRGNVQEVVLQAPLNVVLQLIHQRVRAGEGAGSAHAGMHHAGGEVFRPHLPGPLFQLGVAEALEGEQLCVFRAPAPADVAYLGLGGAQVGEVGVALGVQGLEAPQMHQIARLAGHAEAHPARQVLPEVQHRVALGGHDDLLHRQLFRHAHPAARLGRQHRQIAVHSHGMVPAHVRVTVGRRRADLRRDFLGRVGVGDQIPVKGDFRRTDEALVHHRHKARHIPPGLLQPRVVQLAVIDF